MLETHVADGTFSHLHSKWHVLTVQELASFGLAEPGEASQPWVEMEAMLGTANVLLCCLI